MMGANGIKQTTPAYFFITFVMLFQSLNFLHTILLRFMFKKLAKKCHLKKNSNPFTGSFTT
jgi:hypothetical protein